MLNMSVGRGILGITVFLMVFALAAGLVLAGSDLGNPISRSAEARRADVETQRIAQQNAIDVEQYRIVQEAATRVKIQQLDEEVVHTQRMHEEALRQAREKAAQDLELRRFAGYALIVSIALAAVALNIGFSKRIARPSQPAAVWAEGTLRPLPQPAKRPRVRPYEGAAASKGGNGHERHN